MRAFSKESFPCALKLLLENDAFIFTGRQIKGDCNRLERLGVKISRHAELRSMALEHDATISLNGGTSLSNLCKIYLKLDLMKTHQLSDYSITNFSSEVIEYAALDALISRKISEAILSKLVPISLKEDETDKVISVNDRVKIFLGGKIAGEGIVMHIGTKGSNEKWGTLVLNTSKIAVKVTSVETPNAFLPYSDGTFLAKQKTIQETFNERTNCIIVVPLSSIVIDFKLLESNRNSTKDLPDKNDISEIGDLSDIPEENKALQENHYDRKIETKNNKNLLVHDENDFTELNYYNIDSDDDSPMRRSKRDLFHQFQDLPLPKTCPVKTIIYRLLIQGIYLFVKEDFDKVRNYLVSIKKVRIPLLDHYYHNREWWRERVHMVTPEKSQHANNIRLLHSFIQNESVFVEYYNTDLKKYFLSFESKCEEGMFEELSDVCLFRHVGVDSNGLDLWIRLRGSNRCENFHQKMRSCIGPWVVSVETSHYLLLLLSF